MQNKEREPHILEAGVGHPALEYQLFQQDTGSPDPAPEYIIDNVEHSRQNGLTSYFLVLYTGTVCLIRPAYRCLHRKEFFGV
jgi:hypothetical protein